MNTKEQIILEFFDETYHLLEQLGNLPIDTAVELYDMYETLTIETTASIREIDPEFIPQKEKFFEEYPEMKERIIFAGAITDKAELYKEYERAKIFALSSIQECFPNVYAEALFHGCMFITSDVDPAPDMTKNGELGMVYPLGDVQTLAASLIKMANYADKRAFEKYIPRALDYANKYYDWNRNAKKLAYMIFK